jgi:hypothetical protein
VDVLQYRNEAAGNYSGVIFHPATDVQRYSILISRAFFDATCNKTNHSAHTSVTASWCVRLKKSALLLANF